MRSEQRDSYENQEAPYACYYGTGAPRRQGGQGPGKIHDHVPSLHGCHLSGFSL